MDVCAWTESMMKSVGEHGPVNISPTSCHYPSGTRRQHSGNALALSATWGVQLAHWTTTTTILWTTTTLSFQLPRHLNYFIIFRTISSSRRRNITSPLPRTVYVMRS